MSAGYVLGTFIRDRYALPKGNEGLGLDAYHNEIKQARLASAELLEKLNTAIFKWGFRHGITEDQARVLLLDRKMP